MRTTVQGGQKDIKKPVVFRKQPVFFSLAEKQGFEPWEGINPQRFSRPPLSAAQPPLQAVYNNSSDLKINNFIGFFVINRSFLMFATLSYTYEVVIVGCASRT